MIKGQKELERKFAALEQVCDQQMERLVGQQAKRIQAEAKLLCPVRHGELRNSIKSMAESMDDRIIGTIYTNKAYAMYVEMGTGPKGAANHAGISPVANPSYTMSPWWIHEGLGENEIDRATAEHYHFFHIDTPQGRFYQCSGQAAQPYLYPALKDNEDEIVRIIAKEVKKQL